MRKPLFDSTSEIRGERPRPDPRTLSRSEQVRRGIQNAARPPEKR
jgi:hypothetical protein